MRKIDSTTADVPPVKRPKLKGKLAMMESAKERARAIFAEIDTDSDSSSTQVFDKKGKRVSIEADKERVRTSSVLSSSYLDSEGCEGSSTHLAQQLAEQKQVIKQLQEQLKQQTGSKYMRSCRCSAYALRVERITKYLFSSRILEEFYLFKYSCRLKTSEFKDGCQKAVS